MIAPPFLKPGDTIAVVAPARKVKPEDIEIAKRTFEKWNLKVIESPHLFSSDHSYLAGTDKQRIKGLQQILDDPSVQAIISARGGYGTTRIIDALDFEGFKKHPKWIIGFSDITALHLTVSALGFQSIHGIMPILFRREDAADSIESLRKALFGEELILKGSAEINNKPGTATGKLIGGNLSLLVDSLATDHEPDTTGKILVLEEIDEYLYKLDRMIVQLKRAGKFSALNGLVVGHFTDIKDSELSFGETMQEIIRYHTSDFSFPVGFNFPVGHEHPNLAWRQGATATLQVTYEKSSLTLSLPHDT